MYVGIIRLCWAVSDSDYFCFFFLAVELMLLFRKAGNVLVQLVLCVLNRHRENIGSKFAVAQQSGSDFLRQLLQLAFRQAVFFLSCFISFLAATR